MTGEVAALWKKLNLTDDMTVAVDDPHGAMAAAIAELRTTREVATAPGADTTFCLAFALTLAEVESIAKGVASLAHEDPVVWIAYPKGSSKKYRCEFNRDSGWDSLGAAGFEPVRQVAIDADWSALRFRRVSKIRSMSRGFALTDEGRAKAARGRTTQQPGPRRGPQAQAYRASREAISLVSGTRPETRTCSSTTNPGVFMTP